MGMFYYSETAVQLGVSKKISKSRENFTQKKKKSVII